MDEMSQSDARADCQSQGGELTSIIDASEARFIARLLYVLLFSTCRWTLKKIRLVAYKFISDICRCVCKVTVGLEK